MSRRVSLGVVAALATALAFTVAFAAGTLDGNLLDPTWFGNDPIAFHRTDHVDYLWVRPGFTIKDRVLKIEPWQDFKFLQPDKRDSKDASKAGELTDVMPSKLRGSFTQSLSGFAKVSKDDGDILVVGRFVDVNAGSKAAKWLVGFGAGSATATWDLKLVDRQSGELLAAIHHRCVSGTTMSEIGDKIDKWLDAFGRALRDDLHEYESGKVPKK